MSDRTKTVLHQTGGEEIAQGHCKLMTLEDRCKHGKLTKITERQRECVHQGDNKTHGKQGKRC